jgi:regulator of protease activity HflC (stomatin/prohibitin superfamily)
VDQSKVYENGRYCWGFDHTKVSFPRLFQLVDLDLSVANKEGVSINIDMSFWYRLPKDRLSDIYSKYGTSYDTQITSVSKSIVRNTAVQFSVNDFLLKRSEIRAAMAENISLTLEDMIYIDCPEHMVQLNRIEFSASIEETHLSAAITLENNEQKEYEQNATLIREETDKMVAEYTANTTVVTRTAAANATRMTEIAEANYDQIVGEARGLGLSDTMMALGIDGDENTTQRFLKLMAILDNSATKIVDLSSSATIVSLT